MNECPTNWQKRVIHLRSGAVVCDHGRHYHTLYYKPESLKDICVNHYVKQYIKRDKTELTDIPNWKFLCKGKYEEELEFVMLLCKDNVSD